jgi:hypothetical protein
MVERAFADPVDPHLFPSDHPNRSRRARFSLDSPLPLSEYPAILSAPEQEPVCARMQQQQVRWGELVPGDRASRAYFPRPACTSARLAGSG